ncbi:MAG: hypothetical protein HY698_22065 [Deltaproteobacteria bacterium]|nr:hypothetical protein [Deltaproteobacteria bacterium]
MLRVLVFFGLFFVVPRAALANEQAADASTVVPADVKEEISRALLERAARLHAAGDVVSARRLLEESLAVSPDGPYAERARELLRWCEEKLGSTWTVPAGKASATIGHPEGGVPSNPYAVGDEEPISEEMPLDPYTDTGDGVGILETEDGVQESLELVNPYGAASSAPSAGRRASWLLASGIAWGGLSGLAVGHLVDDPSDSDDGSALAYVLPAVVGGAVGGWAAWKFGEPATPSDSDLLLVNSLGTAGALSGLLVGGMSQPAQGRAYSLNSVLGAAAGLGAGVFLAPRIKESTSRLALIDLGAAAGAALPWVLLYPALQGEDGAVQATSVISLGSMLGGAYVAWRWTKGMRRAEGDAAQRNARGLVVRDDYGTWRLGFPSLGSTACPGAGGLPARTRVMIDLVAGSF